MVCTSQLDPRQTELNRLGVASVGNILDRIPARRTRRIHPDWPCIIQTYAGTNVRRSW